MRLGLFGREDRRECRAVARGAERLGWSVVWQRPGAWSLDQLRPFDAIAVFHLHAASGEAVEAYRREGIPALVVDLPLLRLPDYLAVWLGELNRLPESAPGDRLGLVHFESVPPGPGILVCGQTGGDQAHGMSSIEHRKWAELAVAVCRLRNPKRPIVWRPHPQERFAVEGAGYDDPEARSFEDALGTGGFGAVVTYNSTCGATALRMGLPVWCDPCAPYAALAQTERYPSPAVSIRRVTEGERRAFFARVMYSQWTLDEIASGEPLEWTLTHPWKREVAVGASR